MKWRFKMIKYEVVYIEEVNKREKRKIVIMTAENLVELYKLLQISDIKQVVEIKEIEKPITEDKIC